MDDEDIARAIALSLLDGPPARRAPQPEIITIDDDDEEPENSDEPFQSELQRALQLSAAEASTTRGPKTIPAMRPTTPPAAAPTAPPGAPPVGPSLQSERAQMERERLERLKRLRPDLIDNSGANTGGQRKRGRDGDTETDESEVDEDTRPGAKRHRVSPPAASRPRVDGGAGRRDEYATASAPGEQLFWDGELRQTANALADAAKDTRPTFRLTEIIGKKSDIEFALMASYCVDWPWLYGFFDPKTPVVVIAQPDESGNESIKEVLPNWIKTTPFLRNGRGCMHMKFMLLFHKTGRLRVVICTANSVTYDWKEIENTAWVQDVPLREKVVPRDAKATDFPAQFERVLKALNVEAALRTLCINNHTVPLTAITDLRTKWDFSRVGVQLVASLAGKHEGWPKVIHTGHPALMKAVRDLGARSGGRKLAVECQGSSIGTYSTQWLNEFYHSCRGESAEDWLDQPKSRRAKLALPPVKIVFPSAATVRASRLGEPGGGTMFCRANQWDGAKFPRELFHDSKSKRGGVLMHSKMIIATYGADASLAAALKTKGSKGMQGKGKGKAVYSDIESVTESETESDSDIEIVEPPSARAPPAHGWAYVGSHNLTPSAWGTLSGSAFNPILNITNFEIGIVFRLEDEKHADRVACFERPPQRYKLPLDRAWIQEESTSKSAQSARGD